MDRGREGEGSMPDGGFKDSSPEGESSAHQRNPDGSTICRNGNYSKSRESAQIKQLSKGVLSHDLHGTHSQSKALSEADRQSSSERKHVKRMQSL
eukprot:2865768-Rhodomonas_salina.1